MDVVRIRFRPSRASPRQSTELQLKLLAQQTATPSPTPPPPSRPAIDADDSSGSTFTLSSAGIRQWEVEIQVNNDVPTQVVIKDPFLETEYRSIFEQYLRSSDRPSWSTQTLTLEENNTKALSRAEKRIQVYGEILLEQLGLHAGSFTPGASECRVAVVEHIEQSSPAETSFSASSPLHAGAGIHCLAWELLESTRPSWLPATVRLCVTREVAFPQPSHQYQLRRRSMGGHAQRRPPRSLAEVQANPAETFRILLVVARDFSRTGADRDPEPDLAQWPLMRIHKKLRSRLLLEVVRPGSCEELERHLRVRANQGVQFGLVHFDLHGRVKEDEFGNEIPWLLFAKKDHVASGHGYQVPQTHLAKAEDVARLLANHQIENVVLNACLSAYNRTGSATNLAHIFLRHGIQNVSAMWFYVHWQTVETYLNTFYEELLVKCTEFHRAVQLGREAIRQKPTNRTGWEYRDFFLCVNYTRDTSQMSNSMLRDPSPTPSAKSRGSSNSSKSFMTGVFKPSTPRLGDSFIIGDEPVMHMKLHLLELEYKLLTFQLVYASDLRQESSTLNATIDKMVSMWLSTNMVDEVLFYKAKDFTKRSFLTHVAPREKRTRATSGGYLQLLFPRPVKSLRQTVHIIRDVDSVVDPGIQADALSNERNEEKRYVAQENLQRFTQQVLNQNNNMDGGNTSDSSGSNSGAESNSYVLLLGSQDAQWWRHHLGHLGGELWVQMPWSYTLHSRWMRSDEQRRRARHWSPGGVGSPPLGI